MKAPVIVLLLLVAVGGAGIYLWRSGRLVAHAKAPAGLTLYGNVDVRQVELGFRVAGRLKSMPFEEGQTVDAGAVLAELDTRSFEDALRASKAQLGVEEATLKKVVTGSRPAEIARARASVDEATAARENAATELARTEKLVGEGAAPAQSLDTARAASREAAARLSSSEETLRLLVQGSRWEDVAAARASLDLALANVATAQTSLDDAKLLAPSDGVVISRVREPGAIVSPNDVVYVVSLTRSVWVRAYVSEPELGRVHPGLEVAVRSDSSSTRRFRGHVGFVSPTAEFTPKSVETPELRTDLVYRLRVVVDDPDPGLLQGMPVTVDVSAPGGA